MATRKLILGSAASLMLMSAAPVLAQSNDPAQVYSNAKAQYETELQAYNQKQQTYERERSEYNARVAEYQRSLSAPPLIVKMPDAAVAVVADPDPDVVVVDPAPDTTVVIEERPADRAVVVTDPDPNVVVVADNFTDRLAMAVPPSALVRLESIPDVNYAFFNVPVLDMAGVPVGHFRRIETKDPGVLVAVVTLDVNTQRRTISMATEHVRLDPDRRFVIADLTGREIALIPSGFPYG